MVYLGPDSEYYLHTNGSLIYKPHGGVDISSSFVVDCWNAQYISKTPQDFAIWLSEAYSKGASKSEIKRLAEHNHLLEFIPELRVEFERLGIIEKENGT